MNALPGAVFITLTHNFVKYKYIYIYVLVSWKFSLLVFFEGGSGGRGPGGRGGGGTASCCDASQHLRVH